MIYNLFPTPVGDVVNPDHDKVKNKIIKECFKLQKKIESGGKHWEADLYNTHGTHLIHENKVFEPITNFVYKNIASFAGEIGYEGKELICVDSWFNIYKKGDYQEEHDHINETHIVSVYFLDAEINDSSLCIHGPLSRGIPKFLDVKNQYTWSYFYIKPVPGKLIMFKSDVRHSVKKNNSKKTRISLAYNFKII